MLLVVAIWAVAFSCHAAAGADIKAESFLKNVTSVEELTSIQPEANLLRDQRKEQNVCSRPPDIDGVNSPVLAGEEHPVGTIISYQCKFGFVGSSSSSLISVCRIDRYSGKAKWTSPNITCIPRSCGDPGYLVNGHRIGHQFTFPNKVTFACHEGYKIQGLRDRYCQVSGDWSGKLPTCIPIQCPVPSTPKNGRVLYSSLDYGTELQYKCDKGFALQQRSPRICTEDETWSNDEPECIETTCTIPEAPEYGRVQLSEEPKVGTFAFYSCDDGSTLVGAATSKCLESGDWTFDPPKCSRFCSVPVVENGQVGRYKKKGWYYREEFVSLTIGESVKHNEVVTVRCNEGYSSGNRTTSRGTEVTCNSGTWSEPLHCHAILCLGEPPAIKNGSPRIGRREHGSSIWYKCDPDYYRAKEGKVLCTYGKWEGPTPICASSRCSMEELNYPGLVKPQEESIPHKGFFSIMCEKGYDMLRGKKDIVCYSGVWDIQTNPCIIKTCEEEPPTLKNGKTKEFSRVNGSGVDYECGTDYEMVAPSSVYCAFGEWQGELPVCEYAIKNPVAEESINASVSAPELNITASHFLREECFCTYDYDTLFLRATWKDIEVQNSERISKGERVLFSCRHHGWNIAWQNGLRFLGSMELVCDTCKDWQMQDLPNCERDEPGASFLVYDNKLKIIPGGIIEVPKSERISVMCVNMYLQPYWKNTPTNKVHLSGNVISLFKLRTFTANVTISEVDYEHNGRYECFAMRHDQKLRPVVVELTVSESEVLCRRLSTETNVGSFKIVYSDGRRVNSVARYSCKDPLKKLVGPSERNCLGNGKWSHSFPSCTDIECPFLPENNVLIITHIRNRKPNSVVLYSCKNTYQKLIGPSNRTCLHDGKWSGTIPVCEDITCLAFLTYNGLSVAYSRGTKVYSVATFNCLNQATLVGNSSTRCLRNGTWDHPQPSCQMLEIHCPKLDGKGIFNIQYSNNRRRNSTALFFCKAQDKKIDGCNFMTCQQNGEWSGEYPRCVDMVSCALLTTLPNLNVFYTDGGRVGSVASFECLPPTTLVGSSSATCLSNGTWSKFHTICKAPNCSIHDLTMGLPEKVHPDMEGINSEFVTPGSEVSVMCEDNMVLNGTAKALCNSGGKWEFPGVQCISACRVIKRETSHLIVEPVKDYHRFGEFIILSCPPGQKLTTEVERMMCLGKTWSDTLPDCTEQTEPNSSELTQATLKSR